MSKNRIDVEEVEALQKRRREINAIDFKKARFFKNGVEIEVPKESREEWEFVGLGNIDFVELELYMYAPEKV